MGIQSDLDKEKFLAWLDKLAEVNQLSQAFYAIDHVRKEINKGTFDNDKEEMQKTLEWYANEDNYKMESIENDDFLSYGIEPAVVDRGERARQALRRKTHD